MADIQQVQQPTSISQILGSIIGLGSQYLDLDTQRRREKEAEARARAEEAKLQQQTNIAGQVMPQMAAWGAAVTSYMNENPVVKYGGVAMGVALAAGVYFFVLKKK